MENEISESNEAPSSQPMQNLSISPSPQMSLKERFDMIRSIGEECIQEDELERLLANKPNLFAMTDLNHLEECILLRLPSTTDSVKGRVSHLSLKPNIHSFIIAARQIFDPKQLRGGSQWRTKSVRAMKPRLLSRCRLQNLSIFLLHHSKLSRIMYV
ncbi:hypothetical protein ACS0TY_030368 [Phlomoides rotata]